jgi:hypothetical protein
MGKCFSQETRALKRHSEGTVRVLPIILRPTDWHSAPFGDLKPLPKEAKPVTLWGTRDAAWLDVTMGIRLAAKSLLSRA